MDGLQRSLTGERITGKIKKRHITLAGSGLDRTEQQLAAYAL